MLIYWACFECEEKASDGHQKNPSSLAGLVIPDLLSFLNLPLLASILPHDNRSTDMYIQTPMVDEALVQEERQQSRTGYLIMPS